MLKTKAQSTKPWFSTGSYRNDFENFPGRLRQEDQGFGCSLRQGYMKLYSETARKEREGGGERWAERQRKNVNYGSSELVCLFENKTLKKLEKLFDFFGVCVVGGSGVGQGLCT